MDQPNKELRGQGLTFGYRREPRGSRSNLPTMLASGSSERDLQAHSGGPDPPERSTACPCRALARQKTTPGAPLSPPRRGTKLGRRGQQRRLDQRADRAHLPSAPEPAVLDRERRPLSVSRR